MGELLEHSHVGGPERLQAEELAGHSAFKRICYGVQCIH